MSYVYVLRESGTNYYKIGITKNEADKRRRQLQTGNPRDLVELYVFSAADRHAAESYIENKLARYMTNGGGDEWYEFKTLDNLHIVLNRMIGDRELSLVSSYDGDVNYIDALRNAVLSTINGRMVVAGLCAALVPLLWFLVWSGAFL